MRSAFSYVCSRAVRLVVVLSLVAAGLTGLAITSSSPAGASTQLLGTLGSADTSGPVTSPSGAWLAVQVFSSGVAGVQVSSDNGATWSFVANPSGPNFASIAINDAGELYGVHVNTGCPGYWCSTSFYKRTAGGSWSTSNIGGGVCQFNGDTWILTSGSTLVFYEGNNCGRVLKSTDDGATWTAGAFLPQWSSGRVVGNYVHASSATSGEKYYRWNIATGLVDSTLTLPDTMSPSVFSVPGSTSHLVMVGTTWSGGSGHGGLTLYESTDSGATWTQRINDEPLPAYLNGASGFAMGSDGRIHALSATSASSTVTVLDASRSATGTADWSAIAQVAAVTGPSTAYFSIGGLQRADGTQPSSLLTFGKVMQTSGSYDVYAFSGVGAAVPEAAVTTFTTSTALVSASCGCTQFVASPGRAWEAALTTTGSTRYVLRSTDGTHWDQIEVPSFFANVGPIAINDNGEVYLEGVDSAGYWRSSNFYRFTGGRWFGPIVYAGGVGQFSAPFSMIPLDANTLLAIEGDSGLPYLSHDDGNTWQALAYLGNLQGAQLVVSRHYLVLFSTSASGTWSRVDWTTGTSAPITTPPAGTGKLMANPATPGELWVGSINTGTQQIALYRSVDDGGTWSTIDSGSALPATLVSPTLAFGGDARLYGLSVVGTGGSTYEVRQASRSLGSTTWSAVSTLDTFSASGFISALGSAYSSTNAMPVPADFWVSFTDDSTRHYGQLGGLSGRAVLTAAEMYGGSNIGEPCSPCASGLRNYTDSPVDAATGNFWHTFNELTIPGRGPGLGFALTYNSLAAAANGPSGYGWRHNYQMALSIGSGSTPVTVSQENGAQLTFDLSGTGYVAAARVNATLTHNGDGTWTLLRNQGDTFRFDASGNLISITDLNGYSTTLAYTAGKLVTATDSAGRTLTFAYTGSLLTSVTDTASPARTVQLGYTSGDLTSITDVAGGVTTMSYDASHRMVQMLDPNQQSAPVKHYLTNTYTSGKVTAQTDFAGRTTAFDYTTLLGSTMVTDPKGNVTVERFVDGLPVSITRGFGTASAAEWTTTFDPNTLMPTEVLDPNGHKTVSTYDTHGNVLTRTTGIDTHTVGSVGRTTTYTYNAFNEPLTVTDPMSVVTTNTYDAAGNPVSVSTPIDSHPGTFQAVSYTYDPAHAGDVATMTDPRGKIWQYTYDTYGLGLTVTDPNSKVTKSCYDNIGRQTRSISPKGVAAGVTCTSASPTYTTTYTTNAFGAVLTSTDALGHQTVNVYDADGNTTSSTDAKSHTTGYVYNLDNELIQTNRADTSTVKTDYWADGTVKSQTDGANQTTTYTYDPLGHLASSTDPLGRTTTYISDAVGNQLTEQTSGGNCAATPKTGCTTYAYDAADRVTSVTYSDGVTPDITGVTYDNDDRRTAMNDSATGTMAWAWDSRGRMKSSTVDGDTTTYDYDAAGNLTSIKYPGQASAVTRGYDDAGHWTSVTDTSGRTTQFGYDANSNQTTTTFPTSVNADTVAFDAADQPSSTTFAAGATTLGSLTYSRDNNDQLSGETISGLSGSSATYDYNSLNQLTKRNGSTTWGYDPADNLTQTSTGQNQVFDVANQLCVAGSTPGTCTSPGTGATTFGFNALGERTSQTAATSAHTGYGYDQAHRLTVATSPTPNRVAVGGAFTVAVGPDGAVTAVGANGHGQLGNNSTTESHTWVAPSSITAGSVSALAAGTDHVLALKTDGTVQSWGSNASGQLGNNTTTESHVPVTVSGLSKVVAISAGDGFSIALKSNGTVWAWGDNGAGQLGDGTYTNRSVPVQVTGVSGAIAISAGAGFAFALKADGTVLAWGFNGHGEAGVGTATVNYNTPQAIPTLSRIVAISGGGQHALALRADGTVWAWGANAVGQLGNGTTTGSTSPVQVSGVTDAVAIAAQNVSSHAARADGSLLGWGAGAQIGITGGADQSTPQAVTGTGTGVTLAQGGVAYHVAVTSNMGTLATWGDNAHGQLGDNTITGRLTPIRSTTTPTKTAVGFLFSAIIRSDGGVRTAGENDHGQLGNNSTTDAHSWVTPTGISAGTIRAIAAGDIHTVALKNDSTVVAWGANADGELGNNTLTESHVPVTVSGLSGVVAVTAGENFSAALKSDGTVWTWGDNGVGELGDGTYTDRKIPVQVSGLTNVVAIAAGSSFMIALKSDGTAVAWGYNGDGDLGVGTATVNYRTPQIVVGLSRLVAITAGGLGGGALTADGTVYTWGGNANGQLGNGTTTGSTSPVRVTGINDVTSISAQTVVMHAVRSDGKLWAWGAQGQLGDSTATGDALSPRAINLTDVQSLPVGAWGYSLIATKTDNTTYAWGDNSTGAYGNGTTTSSNDPLGLTVAIQAPAARLTDKPAMRATYDPAGTRRTTTSATTGTTTYTWDQSGSIPLLLSETTSAGTTRHIYGPDGLPVATIDPDGSTRYSHHDQLGSTRLMTGTTGNAIGSLSYDPYGTPKVGGTPITPRLNYAGQYTDPDTGLQYLRARYYDSNTGVFLSRDPLVTETRSSYGYVAQSPLNGTDPSGMKRPGPGRTATTGRDSAGCDVEQLSRGSLVQIYHWAQSAPLDAFLRFRAQARYSSQLDYTADGCSAGSNYYIAWGFGRACIRHDFLYRNAPLVDGSGGWPSIPGVGAKGTADKMLLSDSLDSCEWWDYSCGTRAEIVYDAVLTLGPMSGSINPGRCPGRSEEALC